MSGCVRIMWTNGAVCPSPSGGLIHFMWKPDAHPSLLFHADHLHTRYSTGITGKRSETLLEIYKHLDNGYAIGINLLWISETLHVRIEMEKVSIMVKECLHNCKATWLSVRVVPSHFFDCSQSAKTKTKSKFSVSNQFHSQLDWSQNPF